MKKLFFLLFLSVAATVSAQDVLVTEDGDAIKAWGVDVGGTKIYYRIGEAEDSPTQSIDKNKVVLWKKADGTKVRIGEGEDIKQTPASVSNDEKAPASDVSDPEANAAAIAALTKQSGAVFFYPSSKFAKKQKPAKRICGVLTVSPNSTIVDRNLEMSFSLLTKENKLVVLGGKKLKEAVDNANLDWGVGMAVNVKNKSDKTIFVYMGNTYFLRHGVAVPITQAYASQSAGTGQATGFSQNVVAIPPQSSLNLGSFDFFPKGTSNPFGSPMRNDFIWAPSKESSIKWGEDRPLTPGEVPVDFGLKLAYSFNEGDTQLNHLDAHFYCSKLVGSGYYPAWQYKLDYIKAIGLYFVLKQEVRD